MYRLLLVEDDDAAAESIESLVCSHPCNASFDLTRARSAEEARVAVAASEGGERAPIDVALMDIRLGEGGPTGIDAVRTLFPSGCGTQVIYVTGYVEYCTPVYETEHVYFLLKPVSESDMHAALSKALAWVDSLRAAPLAFTLGGTTKTVLPRRIVYLESDRRKVRVHTDGGVVEAYATLREVAEALPANFVQCHKSFVVNMDRIDRLSADEVLMRSGERIPVSQSRSKATRERFFAHLAARRFPR